MGNKSRPVFFRAQNETLFLFTKPEAFSETQGFFLISYMAQIQPGSLFLLMGSLLIQCFCHQPDLAALLQCHYTLGAGLFSYSSPQLLDPTSSTSRTQTFVGLISSAGALSYFVSEAAGDVKRWKGCAAFYPLFLHFLLQPPSTFGFNALLPLATEISLNMSSFAICTNKTAKA